MRKYTLKAGSILKIQGDSVSCFDHEYVEIMLMHEGKFNPLHFDTIETDHAYYFNNFDDKIQFVKVEACDDNQDY